MSRPTKQTPNHNSSTGLTPGKNVKALRLIVRTTPKANRRSVIPLISLVSCACSAGWLPCVLMSALNHPISQFPCTVILAGGGFPKPEVWPFSKSASAGPRTPHYGRASALNNFLPFSFQEKAQFKLGKVSKINLGSEFLVDRNGTQPPRSLTQALHAYNPIFHDECTWRTRIC